MSETELVGRLERLGRAPRGLKAFAVVTLVPATALANIYATQPVHEAITAHRFIVVGGCTLSVSGKSKTEIPVEVARPWLESSWP